MDICSLFHYEIPGIQTQEEDTGHIEDRGKKEKEEKNQLEIQPI